MSSWERHAHKERERERAREREREREREERLYLIHGFMLILCSRYKQLTKSYPKP